MRCLAQKEIAWLLDRSFASDDDPELIRAAVHLQFEIDAEYTSCFEIWLSFKKASRSGWPRGVVAQPTRKISPQARPEAQSTALLLPMRWPLHRNISANLA